MPRTECVIEFKNDDDDTLRIEREDDRFTFTSHGTTSVWIDFDDIDELVSFLLAMKG